MGGVWSAFPVLDGLWGIIDDPPWDWDPSRSVTSPPWDGIHVGLQSFTWDELGYKPFGVKSPYDYWSMTKDLQASAFTQNAADAVNTGGIQLGLTDDVLGMIGAPVVYVRKQWTGSPPSIANSVNTSTFMDAKSGGQSQALWYSQPYTDQNPTYCTPFTYPNCDMSLVKQSTGTVTMWDGTEIDVVARWSEKVDALAKAYTRGEFDWLVDQQRINPQETGVFDQCTGKFVDNSEVFGLLLGIGLPIAFNIAITIVVPIPLPSITRLTISAGLFSYGYYFGQFATSSFTKDSVDRNRLLLQSSISLGVSGGAVAGSLVGALLEPDGTMPIVLGVAGGVAGYHFLVPYLKTYLNTYTMAGSEFLGGLLNLYTSYMSEMANVIKCKLEDVTITACMDSNQFPRARRWDTASVAVMLLDEVINPDPKSTNKIVGAGSITKGSPEAEFIFRGLLTGPAMMMRDATSGTDWQTGTTGNSIFEQGSSYYGSGVGANPLGSVVPYGWRFDGTTGNYTLDYFYGGDGEKESSADQNKVQNNFACENWGILRWNLDPQNPSNGNNNWNLWLEALIQASRIPANLAKQDKIPGWTAEATLPKSCADIMITYRAADASKTFGTLATLGADALKQWQATNCSELSVYTWFGSYTNVVDMWNYLYGHENIGQAVTDLCQHMKMLKTEIARMNDHTVIGWVIGVDSTHHNSWMAPAYQSPNAWIGEAFDTGVCTGPITQPIPVLPVITISSFLANVYPFITSTQAATGAQLGQWVSNNANIKNEGNFYTYVNFVGAALDAGSIVTEYNNQFFEDDTDKMLFLRIATVQFKNNEPLQKLWMNAWNGFQNDPGFVHDLENFIFQEGISPLPATLLYPAGATVSCPVDWPDFNGVTSSGNNITGGIYYVGADGSMQHYPDQCSQNHWWNPKLPSGPIDTCRIFQGGVDKTWKC
jgi:hypothetical protein